MFEPDDALTRCALRGVFLGCIVGIGATASRARLKVSRPQPAAGGSYLPNTAANRPILLRASGGESLACTHHSLRGPSWLSFLRAHEETEDRKQPATRERGAVLDEWEGLVGGGDGNLAHWRDSIAAGLRSCVSGLCFGRTRYACHQKECLKVLYALVFFSFVKPYSNKVEPHTQQTWTLDTHTGHTQSPHAKRSHHRTDTYFAYPI